MRNISKKRITLGTKQYVPMFEQFLNESEDADEDDMEMEEPRGGEDEEMEEEEMEGSESGEESEEVEERIQEAYRRGLAKGKKLGKVNEGLNQEALNKAIDALDMENPVKTDIPKFEAALNEQLPNAKFKGGQAIEGNRNISLVFNMNAAQTPENKGKSQNIYLPSTYAMQEIGVVKAENFPVIIGSGLQQTTQFGDSIKNLSNITPTLRVTTLKELFSGAL